MFVKLFMIILALGAVACTLLVIRQQRIETAHDMSLIHQRLGENQRTLWRMRSVIAAAAGPDRIRELVQAQGGQWIAIPAPRPTILPGLSTPQRMAGPVAPLDDDPFRPDEYGG